MLLFNNAFDLFSRDQYAGLALNDAMNVLSCDQYDVLPLDNPIDLFLKFCSFQNPASESGQTLFLAAYLFGNIK